MISCNNEVMTPCNVLAVMSGEAREIDPTERVPEYEGKLRHLLPLLAQLQKRRLAGVLVQKVRYVGHRAAIVLRDQGFVVPIVSVAAGKTADRAVQGGDTVVVLLLRRRRARALVLLRGLNPGSVRVRVELVVPVEVGARHHLESGLNGARECSAGCLARVGLGWGVLRRLGRPSAVWRGWQGSHTSQRPCNDDGWYSKGVLLASSRLGQRDGVVGCFQRARRWSLAGSVCLRQTG